MMLLGHIELDGIEYYVTLQDDKSQQTWLLYSVIHPDNYDKIGNERYQNSLTVQTLTTSKCREYLIEGYRRAKKSGRIYVHRSSRRINKILEAFLESKSYNYPRGSIYQNDSDNFGLETFSAAYGDYSIMYTKDDGLYNSIRLKCRDLSISFESMVGLKSSRGLQFEEVMRTRENKLQELSINHMGVETAFQVYDLSWYKNPETGECNKDYVVIKTIDDLESKCITPMVRKIINCAKQGIKLIIGCDTETTGFNLLLLSDDNPSKDRISTIQFSWEDDQGVIIFLDMKYFENVDKTYMFKRLYPLFKYYTRAQEGKEVIKFHLIKDEDGNDIDEYVDIVRGSFDLGGHNVMFDSRVTLAEGYQFYFTQDSLQMSFNLDPVSYKRNKGLKNLSKRLLNQEMPELTDIFGKGNEGCFRLLKDEELAKIYGCADVDQFRKVYRVLKDITPPKMYHSYCKLDPITWYVSAQSEYRGLKLNEKLVKDNVVFIKQDLDNIKELIYSYVGKIINKMYNTDSGIESNDRYEFKLAGKDLKRVVFDILGYPVIVRSAKTGEPSVNSVAIKKMLKQKLTVPSNIMQQDLMSAGPDTSQILISASKFNSYKYPLAYLLKEYATLNKEYTTYYKPFEKEDLEGRLFKSISTTNIETRRMSCAAQIIKKNLKKAVVPYSEDYYNANWDLEQVEARVFTSLAGDEEGINKLNGFDTDYHTENAARMYSVAPFRVDSNARKDSKKFGFGLPYGMGDDAMCEGIYGEVNELNLIETRRKRMLFENALHIEMDYLNGIRASALNIVNAPVELKRFWGLPDDAKIGMVVNENGFYRYFYLDEVLGTKWKEASVGRKVGNFPIQSYAADIYRTLLKRLYDKIFELGLTDKIMFDMYIHDEVQMSVHKSIDPRFLAKIVHDTCVIKLKGHTVYYVGLSFGDSWYACKASPYEMPPGCLYRLVKNFDSYELQSWTEDPVEIMGPIVSNYKRDRVLEELPKFTDNEGNLVLGLLDDNFQNYKVRSYATDRPKLFEIDKESDLPEDLISGICSCLVEVGKGDFKLKLLDDTVVTVNEYLDLKDLLKSNEADEPEELDLDFDEFEIGDSEDSFYSFDDDDSYFDCFVDKTNGIFEFTEDSVNELSPLEVFDKVNKNCKLLGSKYVLKIKDLRNSTKVLKFIEPYRSNSGKGIILESLITSKIIPYKYELDLDKVEEFLETL